MVTLVNHLEHLDLKPICASHPYVELAKQVLFYQGGLFLRTRDAAVHGECLNWGRLIKHLNSSLLLTKSFCTRCCTSLEKVEVTKPVNHCC